MTNAFKHHGNLILVAASASGLQTEIEVMPVGAFQLADSRRFKFAVSNAEKLIRASMAAAHGGELRIDFDHAIFEGKGGPAAGWITAMRVEGDKIVATVRWTPKGQAAIEAQEYRFISPEFTSASEGGGEILRILAASLTNDPAIHELAKVASKEKSDMDPHLQAIATALGLGEDVTEAEIATAASAAIAVAGHAGAIVTAAGLTGALTEEGATTIAAKLKAGGAADVDPGQYVPKAMFDELSATVASLQKGRAEDAAGQAIATAKADGKVTPGMEDWARGYAEKDPAGFADWVASAPVIVSAKRIIPGGAAQSQEQGGLTDVELQVCAATGQDPKAFLAVKGGGTPVKKEDA